MDTKRLVMGMVLITVLMYGWQYFLNYEYRVHGWRRPGDQTEQPQAQTQPATEPTTRKLAQGPSTGPSTSPAIATTGPSIQPPSEITWHVTRLPDAAPSIVPAGENTATFIGSNQFQDSRYRVGLTLVPQGASVDLVQLNQFRQVVDKPEIFEFQEPYDFDKVRTRSLATTAVIIDGTPVEVWNADWRETARTDHSARFAIDLAKGKDSAVRVLKDYEVLSANNDPKSPQGYEVQVNYTIQNLSKDAHKVALQFNGPTVSKAETARQDTEVVAGLDYDQIVKFDHQPAGGVKKEVDFVANDEKLPLMWMGESSNYFNAIVHPAVEKQLAKAVARPLDPDGKEHPVGIEFTTVDFALQPRAAAALPMHVFFGPKSREVLNSHYYSTFPNGYDETLVMVTGVTGNPLTWCGLCTFTWLISFLVTLLKGLHAVLFHDWGLAIIALVIGVRLLLHPITKRSQVSMMGMQKLAPEIERLKKKYGDDKEGFTKAQMDLYKSVGFTPILGCLPMFLQMPIFIALWRALQTTFELRQAPFLEFFGIHFTWIHDLAAQDLLFKFDPPIKLPFGILMAGINILPIAMAVVTFINQKYFVPRPAAMTPEQTQQQKMMTYMTLIFPFMFYTFPSGLNLYYLTSTSLGIFESKRIRAHIKEREELEKMERPVIVDAGKSSRRRREDPPQGGSGANRGGGPKPKPGGLSGFLANLQAKAEQMTRDAEKKRNNKKA